MARTARSVKRLVDSDPEMVDAIETVLETYDDGEIQWADVNDELTSGQWGRLIQTDILVDGAGDGFEVKEPAEVRSELYDEPDEADPEKPEDEGWSTYDKLAGLGALTLMVGYYFTSIRDAVGGALDVVLGPVTELVPFYVVILILATLTGVSSALIQSQLMDFEIIEYYKGKMDDIKQREEAAKERGDEEAVEEIRKEQMEQMTENLGMFKAQFRPTVWIMLVNIPLFLWMYWLIFSPNKTIHPETITAPMVGEVTWQAGVVGPMQMWIVWYFLCSLAFSQIVRKAIDIQISPS